MPPNAVSVIMPVHNGMPYLPASINSILGQTFSRFELLIIDDGSTDDTPRYCASLADARVKYHRLEKVGIVGAMNYGLRQASAPIIARMDADDVAMPSRFGEQLRFLEETPSCVLVGCSARVIDQFGAEIGASSYPRSDAAIRWEMHFTNPILHPGVMYPRATVLDVGGYCGERQYAEDYDLWARLSRKGTLANLPAQLLYYRVHPASTTSTKLVIQDRVSTDVAGSYGALEGPENCDGVMRELHAFIRFSKEPELATATSLASLYTSIRSRFCAGSPDPGTELGSLISKYDRVARWRCIGMSRKWAVRRPLTAIRWLQAAKWFDPAQGSVVSIAARKLRATLGNRAATGPRGSSGALRA